ncbi:biotin transporter BioY [Paramicrobacterium agarici]|uniref:Biotin transporter n=1 Tax=Paramicrobacterium agarici TaxID=630514 RepID=A0A2A9DX33_9MICO|nr:biotin transporter BioY [Microbacterium agarici]PFG30469.1 biotin transport system substrate-specific component [Microbacterium agarici]TQO23482.1 biotin transport system substrate-specific component [Microbacterium agarici]
MKTTLNDITRIATFAAIIAVLGIPGAVNPFGMAVPITLQTLGVMLAGAILGWWRGAASVIVLLVLTAAGLPLLSGGRGGIGVFFAPSSGYLVGWVLGAAVVGAIVHIGATRPVWWRVTLGVVVGGMLAIYAVGIPVMAATLGLSLGEAALANLAFVPGDAIKAGLTVALTMAVWKAYPRAFAMPRRAAVEATPVAVR